MLLLKLIGLLLLAAGAVGCAKTLHDLRSKPDRFNGFIAPAIAVELAHSGDDIKHALADIGAWLRKEQKQQTPAEFLLDGLRTDRRFIIPTYWVLLMVFSLLLYRHHFAQAKLMGIAAAICASAAAAWDYAENNRIEAALAQTAGDEAALGILHASLWKWGLIFVATALLAAMFLWRRDWVMIIGALYLLGALLGLIGLSRHHLIEWAIAAMLAAMAGWGALLLFDPKRFLAGFS